MKNDAESKGAEEAPISGTLGTESGRGVVSMRISWLNLRGEGLVVMLDLGGGVGNYRGCLADILGGVGGFNGFGGMWWRWRMVVGA
jgi:hypothetical protein